MTLTKDSPAVRSSRSRRWWARDDGSDVGSFRRQIVVATALLGTLVSVALVTVVQLVLAHASADAITRVLADRGDAVTSSADSTSTSEGLTVPDALLVPGVAVYDDEGRLLAGSVPPAQAQLFTELSRSTSTETRTLNDEYEVLARPFSTTAGPTGVVVLTEPVGPYENDERYALVVSLIAGAMIVLVATSLAAWASRRALAPVAAMAATADEWSEHDLDRRFDLGAPTNEIRALGHTLDALLGRVAGAILAEQRLTSELAHELRTPLTTVLATADLMIMREDLDDQLRADLTDILASGRVMASTITSLLDLARAHTSRSVRTHADLATVLEDVRRQLSAPERVSVDVDDAVVVALPQELAVRAISPVVDNATQAAGRVHITATTDEGVVHILVADDGPGVRAADADRIFEPGHTTTGGHGLGLALARRVARSAGGDVTLASPQDQTGATFLVSLPAG